MGGEGRERVFVGKEQQRGERKKQRGDEGNERESQRKVCAYLGKTQSQSEPGS